MHPSGEVDQKLDTIIGEFLTVGVELFDQGSFATFGGMLTGFEDGHDLTIQRSMIAVGTFVQRLSQLFRDTQRKTYSLVGDSHL